jgi:hypothetical protein
MESLKENELLINGKNVDELFASLEKLYEYAVDHKCEPGMKATADCPVCGAKATMTYAFSPYNEHLRASCSACGIAIMQ